MFWRFIFTGREWCVWERTGTGGQGIIIACIEHNQPNRWPAFRISIHSAGCSVFLRASVMTNNWHIYSLQGYAYNSISLTGVVYSSFPRCCMLTSSILGWSAPYQSYHPRHPSYHRQHYPRFMRLRKKITPCVIPTLYFAASSPCF